MKICVLAIHAHSVAVRTDNERQEFTSNIIPNGCVLRPILSAFSGAVGRPDWAPYASGNEPQLSATNSLPVTGCL